MIMTIIINFRNIIVIVIVIIAVVIIMIKIIIFDIMIIIMIIAKAYLYYCYIVIIGLACELLLWSYPLNHTFEEVIKVAIWRDLKEMAVWKPSAHTKHVNMTMRVLSAFLGWTSTNWWHVKTGCQVEPAWTAVFPEISWVTNQLGISGPTLNGCHKNSFGSQLDRLMSAFWALNAVMPSIELRNASARAVWSAGAPRAEEPVNTHEHKHFSGIVQRIVSVEKAMVSYSCISTCHTWSCKKKHRRCQHSPWEQSFSCTPQTLAIVLAAAASVHVHASQDAQASVACEDCTLGSQGTKQPSLFCFQFVDITHHWPQFCS